ncbi:MAG: EAL domain-containing protein [Alphaproteobacteria bacterium]|jgi:cyclic-di-GMP phosphodiesterase TipF (flagellum assembly factor)
MLLHAALVVAYAALALGLRHVAAEMLGPEWRMVPEAAIVAFLAAATIHLLSVVVAVQRRADRGFAAMQASQRDLRQDIEAARVASHALQETLGRGAEGREGERAAMGEVVAEVKVLQSLVSELSVRGEAGEQPAPAAAAAAPAAPRATAPRPPAGTAAGRDLAALGEGEVLSLVRHGLREGRVDLYVQPIVSLPQRKHRFYECFSRIRDADGNVMGPDRYLAAAEREGLIGAVDNMLLFRCVQLVRRIHKANREVGVFVNISEHSIADQRFFRDFANFVADNRELAPYLVFEFAQAHVARHGAAVMLELERLARRGFRFSMDQVTDLNLDVDTLSERQFRFIKVDAQRLLHAARAGEPRLDMRAFKAALDRNRIDLIVERIEDEQTMVELLDYPLDFGQGYLFGEPRLAKTGT